MVATTPSQFQTGVAMTAEMKTMLEDALTPTEHTAPSTARKFHRLLNKVLATDVGGIVRCNLRELNLLKRAVKQTGFFADTGTPEGDKLVAQAAACRAQLAA